jgi:hypothetical protein
MIDKHVGYAGDLGEWPYGFGDKYSFAGHLPGTETLVSLCDLLLLHQTVYIESSPNSFHSLLRAFTQNELEELTKSNRLRFYVPIQYYNDKGYVNEIEKSISWFSEKTNNSFFKSSINGDRFRKIVFDNTIDRKTDSDFGMFEKQMNHFFYESPYSRIVNIVESKDTASHLIQKIFSDTLNNIRALWAVGVFSINFDFMSGYYIDICEKAASYIGQEKEVGLNNEVSIFNKMHVLKNIPTLTDKILTARNPSNKLIKIVNSNEAADLRNFLNNLKENNCDLRDIYIKNISTLPSKTKWIDWLRFGSVSVISSILGTILTANPLIGSAIGFGVGAADKRIGDNVINSITESYSVFVKQVVA